MQRVAIIGAGHMAKIHGTAYANMLNAQPVAVIDVHAGAAEALATSLDAEAYTDFGEMLSVAQPDVIDICTPTPTHKDYVLQAVQAGKHIVLEKPMARTLADCREMIDAANRAGITFMVAQVLRFFPEFIEAKAQIDKGAVGKPAVVRTSRGGGFPGGWFGNFEMSGGVIMDALVHDFDWLLWTFGEAKRVYAKGLGPRLSDLNIDYALVTIRFANGVIAHVEGNWAYAENFTVRFEVAGDAGLLDFFNLSSMPLRIVLGESGQRSAKSIPESPTSKNPYFTELQHFIDCVESGTKPSISPEDSMRAVEVALAALESIRTGQPVDLPMVNA